MAIFENLFVQQQLYLWQLIEVECDIQKRTTELKARINYDIDTILARQMFGEKNEIQNRIIHFLNKTKSDVSLENMKVFDLIDNQIELCNIFDDAKECLKQYYESSKCNKIEYVPIYDDSNSTIVDDVKDIFVDTSEMQAKVFYPEFPISNVKTINRDKIKNHLQSSQPVESASGNIICSICKQEFADLYLRAAHLRKEHKSVKSFPCDRCNRAFYSLFKLNDHLIQHTGEKPFICDICNKQFSRKESIVRHMMKHSTFPYLCSICGVGKESAHVLTSHMLMHSVEKNFKCSYAECDKTFVFRASMLKHIKKIHRGIVHKFECAQCPKFFTTNYKLKLHVTRQHGTAEKPYKCSICNRDFYTSGLLKVHQKIHGPRELFPCFECNRAFKSKSGLQEHLLTHTSERNVKCNECSKKFYSTAVLKQHMQSAHHIGEYTCETCNSVFTSIVSYKHHINSHTKPFECHICEKSFAQKITLNHHLLRHAGEKPYVCDICTKGFVQQSDMKTHRRIHTGEKPFSCPHCDRKFTDNRNMKKHMKIHVGK